MNRPPFGGYAGGLIDTMIGFPTDTDRLYASLRDDLLRDAESRRMSMPAEYMFHDVPDVHDALDDPVAMTLAQMNRFGIEVGLISLTANRDAAERALRTHPDRFTPSLTIDPTGGSDALRTLRREHTDWNVTAVSAFPHGVAGQPPLDQRIWYPVYATCVELDLPLFVTVGVAGPRVPSVCQHVELLDPVLCDFPELTVVMRHGAEPWVDLAIELMRRRPNLYYSTSAFAPKYYPAALVDFANDGGADRVIYGGYFPMGLSLERIIDELRSVGFDDEVWPLFLHDNAAKVLGLGADR